MFLRELADSRGYKRLSSIRFYRGGKGGKRAKREKEGKGKKRGRSCKKLFWTAF